MSIESISSINCLSRNQYEKSFCEGLNPDRIDDFLKPYNTDMNSFFNKDKFLLEDEKEKIDNITKEECAIHSINNNYAGFNYKGDRNKCLLFNSYNFDKKKNKEFDNYKMKTYLKTKDTIDIKNIEDQLDSSKYFTQTNNDYLSNDIIGYTDVLNEDQCMDNCVRDYKNCKSVVFMEQPKSCFFNNIKKMKKNKNNVKNFDTYTVKSNKIKDQKNIVDSLLNNTNNLDENYNFCKLSNDQCFLDYSINKFRSNNEIIDKEIYKVPVYNCAGLDSTNPFCTKEYNSADYTDNPGLINYTGCLPIGSIEEQPKIFDKACKEKYGNEYMFDDDIYNMEAVLKCEDQTKMAKCKLSLEHSIEGFENKTENKSFIWILFFILLIIIIYFFSR